MQSRLIFAHAFSPLQAGTGQGVGTIDLPIAREKATGLPILPGSSLKGVLRDACENKEIREKVFGPEPDAASEFAGSAAFSDLRLLLLPVRSVIGTFAWVTSPFILMRFLRDIDIVRVSDAPSKVPNPNMKECFVSDSDCVICENNQVLLEDLELQSNGDSSAREWGEWIGKQLFPSDGNWQEMLPQRLCIVNDTVLSFLLDTATEVFARIRLDDDTKTVKTQGLWYEEALPAESILSGIVAATHVKATPEEVFEVLGKIVSKPLQLGGKSTVGRGVCRITLSGGIDHAN
ncbi:MAG TPA: type III-B CRISPR module RAMP protein Cmr4 [Bacillota bacterium]|nr:type III-B CRISPR module RAMP protein Cmr4 [Bacillota bacterium]